MKKLVFSTLLALLLASCSKMDDQPANAVGYRPIYVAKDLAFKITTEPAKSFAHPGKMFLYQNYIYITDYGTGVHIIDNSDPAHPQKLAFVGIPGVRDAAVKNGILLADNFTDLVAIDITDLSNVHITKRVAEIYPVENQMFPEFATGYFECVDTAKGYVAGWEKVNLSNPKCYR